IGGNAGAGIIKAGPSVLELGGANTYSGLTTVSNGFIFVTSPTAFGSTNSGTVLAGGGIELDMLTITNESLTNIVAGSVLEGVGRSGWSSNIVLNADLDVKVFSGGSLTLSGVISGSGGV